MPSRFRSVESFVSAVLGVAEAVAVAVVLMALSLDAWLVLPLALACGLGTYVLALKVRLRMRQRWLEAAQQQSGHVMRELIAMTVPGAAARATTADGSIDSELFRDLVIATLAKVTGQYPEGSRESLGPATGEPLPDDVRSPDQNRRFRDLLVHPDISEAPRLLAVLQSLGPLTINQFAEFARHARGRLAVGLEPVRGGPPDAILTGRLITAGLVERVDGPAPGMLRHDPGSHFYALTDLGYEVARFFSPQTVMPKVLAALDEPAQEAGER